MGTMIFHTGKKWERSGRDKKEVSRMGENYILYMNLCVLL